MQQIPATPYWTIQFLAQPGFINPLMGWQGGYDVTQQLANELRFATKEDAIKYAARQGFDYEVIQDNQPKKKVKMYQDNFRWRGPDA